MVVNNIINGIKYVIKNVCNYNIYVYVKYMTYKY